MSEEDFKAPDWVTNDEGLPPLTLRQKIFFRVVVALATPFCLWAGWYEWNRAHEGHWRAWVYTFEWPFFAIVLIYLYRRFSRGDIPKIPRPQFREMNEDDSK